MQPLPVPMIRCRMKQLHRYGVQDLTVSFIVATFPHMNLQQQLVHPFHPSLGNPLLQHVPLGALDIHAHHRQVCMTMALHNVTQRLYLIIGLLAIERAFTRVRSVGCPNPNGLEQMVRMAFVLLDPRHRWVKREDLTPLLDHDIVKNPVIVNANRVHHTSRVWYGIQTDVNVRFLRILTLENVRLCASVSIRRMEQLVNLFVSMDRLFHWWCGGR